MNYKKISLKIYNDENDSYHVDALIGEKMTEAQFKERLIGPMSGLIFRKLIPEMPHPSDRDAWMKWHTEHFGFNSPQ